MKGQGVTQTGAHILACLFLALSSSCNAFNSFFTSQMEVIAPPPWATIVNHQTDVKSLDYC
jgi:hypothetical protein